MSQVMRIQKYLSQAGVCSRRKAEEYIRAGQVYVNGQVASIGMSINPNIDTIVFGDRVMHEQKNFVYYKYHKPRGIETTCAQRGGKSIVDIVDVGQRIFPIGRLDKDSTGLILLTNDGRITNYLTHPRYRHEKEYIVETFGSISDKALNTISQGVPVLGKLTLPCFVRRISSGTFCIILCEGRNRQIRRMVEYVGSKVKKLKRIRIENIQLGNLGPGDITPLSTVEKKDLFNILGL